MYKTLPNRMYYRRGLFIRLFGTHGFDGCWTCTGGPRAWCSSFLTPPGALRTPLDMTSRSFSSRLEVLWWLPPWIQLSMGFSICRGLGNRFSTDQEQILHSMCGKLPFLSFLLQLSKAEMIITNYFCNAYPGASTPLWYCNCLLCCSTLEKKVPYCASWTVLSNWKCVSAYDVPVNKAGSSTLPALRKLHGEQSQEDGLLLHLCNWETNNCSWHQWQGRGRQW